MTDTVPAAQGVQLAQDRILEIVNDKLSAEIDSIFTRSGNLTASGIYLPDPDQFIRQDAPDQQEFLGVSSVSCYVGATGQTDYAPFRSAGASGYLVEASIPFAASIVFARAASQPTVSDPVLGGSLSRDQITQRRAEHYAGALKHTITKWAKIGSASTDRARAVRKTTPQSDFSRALRIFVGEDESVTRGVASYQFTVHQRQLVPPLTQT